MKKPGSRPLTSSPVNTPLGPTMVRIFSISVGSTEAAIAALADLVITAPTFCFAPRRDGVEHGSLPAAGEPAGRFVSRRSSCLEPYRYGLGTAGNERELGRESGRERVG